MKAQQQNQKRTQGGKAQNPNIQPAAKSDLHSLSMRLSSEQYLRLRRFVISFEDQTGQVRMQQVVFNAALKEYFGRDIGLQPRWILEMVDIYAQPENREPERGRSHMITWRLTRDQYRRLRLIVVDVEEQTGRRLTHQSILQSVLAKYMARNRPGR
jgi:hypothetical protein